MKIDTLDDAQRNLLDLIRRGGEIPPRRVMSASALVAAGYLLFDPLRRTYTLSSAGKALFEEMPLAKQTLAEFSVGMGVEYSLWFRRVSGRVSSIWCHEWVAGAVVAIGETRLYLKYLDSSFARHLPTMLRKGK